MSLNQAELRAVCEWLYSLATLNDYLSKLDLFERRSQISALAI